jgi:DNA-binding IclR family transcriptional regulator
MIYGRQSKSAPVGVVSKVLRILEAINQAPSGLQLREIAQQTGINKSTAYRFMAHLETEGYLFRDETGAYIVGPKLVRLGSGANYQATIRTISRPVVQNLWKATSETVNLGVLDGHDVFYLDVVQSPHPFRMAAHKGAWRPLNSTAMGKALLAYLPDEERDHIIDSLKFEKFSPFTITSLPKLRKELAKIREQGYSLDNEEAVLGTRCVSAPILMEDGRAAAAISVAGPVTRVAKERVPFFAKAVMTAAKSISNRLSNSGTMVRNDARAAIEAAKANGMLHN